jgi:hypothetical protein
MYLQWNFLRNTPHGEPEEDNNASEYGKVLGQRKEAEIVVKEWAEEKVLAQGRWGRWQSVFNGLRLARGVGQRQEGDK